MYPSPSACFCLQDSSLGQQLGITSMGDVNTYYGQKLVEKEVDEVKEDGPTIKEEKEQVFLSLNPFLGWFGRESGMGLVWGRV